jgi:DNA-binding NarL/FixJ family response regulator
MHTAIALVVEDHDGVRQALCDRIQLSFQQCQLRQACSISEALKIVETEKIDVVLMDIQLPGMNGIDGTREVLERSPNTSVVVVSLYDDLDHRSAATRAGAKAYVCKRAITRELIPLLDNLIPARQ